MATVMNREAALDLASEKMIAWGQDPDRFDRYPNRTHFIGIEHPEHDRMATKTLLRGDPVVLIYPDGSELLIDPDPGGGARVETRDSSGKPIAA
ncbi:MAG TPA: hypothetical protein VFY69_11175 [Solirubrobacterales bacterium]|nr:hypothetical protein [Solirubrobacterales bacterium]